MTVLVVTAGKPPEVRTMDGSLEAMQEIVGGTIEAIYPFDDCAIVCNDEGKINGMDFNRALRDPTTGEVLDLLFGPFFLCGLGQENFASLPDDLIERYAKEFAAPELLLRLDDRLLVLPV